MSSKTISSSSFIAAAFDLNQCQPSKMNTKLRKFLEELRYEFGNLSDATIVVLRNFVVSPIMDLDTMFETIKHNVEILDEQQERLTELLLYSHDMFNMIIKHFNKKKNFQVIDCNLGCLQFTLVSVKLVMFNLYNLLMKHDIPVHLMASKSKIIEDGIHSAWHALVYNVLLNEFGPKVSNHYLIHCTPTNLIKHVGMIAQILFVDEIYIKDDSLTFLLK